MKKSIIYAIIIASAAYLISCGDSKPAETESTTQEAPVSMVEDPTSYDPKRGEGKFNNENLTLGEIDTKMASEGEVISGVKCTSCHKISDEKLVGPGWKGVTTRREPSWIMNFITNPDPMIDKDPELQSQLELCLVRMPNQGLTDDDARKILEFMRKNDSVN